MKKLIYISILAVICSLSSMINISAQSSATSLYSSSGTTYTSDTVVNSATEYLYLKVVNSYDLISLQFVGTKVSGTVGGTVTLEVSNDGSNYVAIDTSATLKVSTDSYTQANQTTNTFVWTVTKPAYLYYRFKVAGSGTMSQIIRAYAIARTGGL